MIIVKLADGSLWVNSPVSVPCDMLDHIIARVSVVSQNQPLKVEIKGFKTSHFFGTEGVFTRICKSLGEVFYDRRLDVPKILLVRKGAQLRNLPRLLPAKGKAASSSTATSFKGFTLDYEEQDKNKEHLNGNHS